MANNIEVPTDETHIESKDSGDNIASSSTTSESKAAAQTSNAESTDAIDNNDESNADSSTATTISNDDSLSTESTAISESDDITILMVGDILLHTPIEDAAKDENGNYNFDFIFADLKDEISAADLAIVNQEVIIGGEELGVSGYPGFNAPVEIGDALVDAGFDVVCHSTNHVLDKGKTGLVNCYNYWKEKHPEITVIGINSNEDEYNNIDIIEKKGVRIAILNYTYGTNGIPLPSDMPYAVDLLDKEKIITDLKYAEENADFTIVCPHWGTEYNLGIDSNQEYYTELFRTYGADLVLGTHPHVIEPIEMFEDNNTPITNNHGDGDMLVYYSLGNFVNWTSSSGDGIANRMVGGMAQITIGKDSNNELAIKDYGVRSIVCHLRTGHEGISVYPLSDYSESLANTNEIIKQDSHFSKEYCVDLCNKVWGDIWK
ncbi:CapA family protein [Butyrivibrio sp. YAB3001]|uniref:CapA family protein n=1 Tax=Butyrivibrio sp. YAB3001 TaxID=1520812 RepID=UPI001FA87513|nr:CapA family protein [Butyrivibrio sp. YAB3001]